MKTIIFDLDGTLLNTLKDLTVCTNVILSRHNFKERTIEEMRSFVGSGIKKMIERALPKTATNYELETCFEEMLVYYKLNSSVYTKPYDGVIEMLNKLNKLNKFHIAIVTNKAQLAANDICKKFFDGLAELVVGDDKKTPLKPNPDNIYKVLNKWNCKKEDAIYIGDSEIDLLTAKNSELKFIAVAWGFRDKSFLKEQGAKVVVDNAEELTELLLKNFL